MFKFIVIVVVLFLFIVAIAILGAFGGALWMVVSTAWDYFVNGVTPHEREIRTKIAKQQEQLANEKETERIIKKLSDEEDRVRSKMDSEKKKK